jgi:hypothetical protein
MREERQQQVRRRRWRWGRREVLVVFMPVNEDQTVRFLSSASSSYLPPRL